MRMLFAIMQPYKVDDAIEALNNMGVTGVTVQEVKGYARQRGRSELYRGQEYGCNFVPKVQLMTLISDGLVETAMEILIEACQTGKVGDGIVWDIPFAGYYRVRTGEFVDDRYT